MKTNVADKYEANFRSIAIHMHGGVRPWRGPVSQETGVWKRTPSIVLDNIYGTETYAKEIVF